MKFNFDTILYDMDGKTPVLDPNGKEVNLGKFAATLLMNSTEKTDLYKRFNWAKDLHAGLIDLDKAGQEEFRKFVETVDGIGLHVRMAILDVLTKRSKQLDKELGIVPDIVAELTP
jgi:hypothetical protein